MAGTPDYVPDACRDCGGRDTMDAPMAWLLANTPPNPHGVARVLPAVRLTPQQGERNMTRSHCLTCGHEADQHAHTADAPCLKCDCHGLHLDIGGCTDDCYPARKEVRT